MNDLLTAREVQELLKLDRTTVYRMLKDGRLGGVKVGQQWRFRRREVDALLGGAPAASAAPAAPSAPAPSAAPTALAAPAPLPLTAAPTGAAVLPLHCVQAIQDVFADLAGVGALTTAPDGTALTEVSNGCRFCALVQSNPAGHAACRREWAALAACSEAEPHTAVCHAGLCYLYGRIDVAGHPVAMLVGGQFREPGRAVDTHAVAERYGLDPGELAAALAETPQHDAAAVARIGAGLRKVAATFASIAQERAIMLGRLRHIAELSAVEV